jgi:hypothetical protein
MSSDEESEVMECVGSDAESDVRPVKRQKTTTPAAAVSAKDALASRGKKAYDWTICITNRQELTNFLKIIGQIVTMAHFKVQQDGILCESINTSKTCMFKFYLNCKVTDVAAHIDLSNEYFCVNIDLFIAAIKVEQSELLIMKDGDHVCIRSGCLESNVEDNVVDTLVDDPASLPMVNMKMDYGVDMSLTVLRQFCKTAKERRAEEIRITLKQPQEDLLDGLKHMFVELFADCVGIKKTRTMHSVTKTDTAAAADEAAAAEGGASAQYVVRVADHVKSSDYGEMTTLYSGRFQLSFLESLIKYMKGETVHLHFSKNKPLIVRYGLGSGQSHIFGVLVAKKEKQ